MPQAKSRTASASTRKRLLRAKSTTARIISRSRRGDLLLLDCGLESQSVRHNLLTWLNARDDFLSVVREHLAAGDFNSAESSAFHRHVDPLPIVQMPYRGRRNGGVRFGFRPVKCCGDKHAEPQHTR